MNPFLARIFIAILIACLLVACGTTPTPIPALEETEILPPIEPNISTPLPSRTPLPPPTRRPSQTPTPPLTQPASQTPYQTEVNFAKSTLWAPFSACNGATENERWLSPKKNWYICGYDGGTFKVINRDATSWPFSAEQQFGVKYDGAIQLVHWTADEKFLYLSVMRSGGDGPNPMNINADALLRMDLSNGKVSIVLGGIKTDLPQNVYVVSISPTSRYLAYSVYDLSSSPKLHLVNLQNSDEKVINIDLEYDGIGSFAWSVDGQQLTYKLYTSTSEKDGYCTYTYSIRFLDLRDFSSTTFVKNVSVSYCDNSLPEFDVVEISANEVVLRRNNEIWVYDVKSQKLELQSTVTPPP